MARRDTIFQAVEDIVASQQSPESLAVHVPPCRFLMHGSDSYIACGRSMLEAAAHRDTQGLPRGALMPAEASLNSGAEPSFTQSQGSDC